jgi:hypothetical protein
MPIRPLALLVPLLGIVLAIAAPIDMPDMATQRRGRGGPGAEANPYGAWSSAFRLKKHMVPAMDWAGEALSKGGRKPAFITKPTAIVSSPEIVADVLRADWSSALTLLGAKDNAAKTKMAAGMATYVVAVYAPRTGVIHVIPENAQRAAAAAGDPTLMSEDVLRLLLARMCLLALDRQHTPEAKAAIDAATSLDALQIGGAVLQGHVQFHTRRIAASWNQADSKFSAQAFNDLVTLLTAPAPANAPASLKAFAAGVKFALVDGETFMANIPRTRHKQVLRKPPTDRAVLFDPKSFVAELRGAGKGAVKLSSTSVHTDIQKEFKEAVLKAGTWNETPAALTSEDAKALLTPLASTLYSMAIAAFKSGHHIRSARNDEADAATSVLDVYVLEFSKAGPAETFVSLVRGAAKQRGGALVDGAGRDDNLAGFHGKAEVETDGSKHTWHMQWASEGRFVVGFRTAAPISKVEDRDPYDDAMEAASEILAKIAKTRDSRRRRRGR